MRQKAGPGRPPPRPATFSRISLKLENGKFLTPEFRTWCCAINRQEPTHPRPVVLRGIGIVLRTNRFNGPRLALRRPAGSPDAAVRDAGKNSQIRGNASNWSDPHTRKGTFLLCGDTRQNWHCRPISPAATSRGELTENASAPEALRTK